MFVTVIRQIEPQTGNIHRSSSSSTEQIIDKDVIQENDVKTSLDDTATDSQSSMTNENIAFDMTTQPTCIIADENNTFDYLELCDSDSRTENENVHRRDSKSQASCLNQAFDNSLTIEILSNIDCTLANQNNIYLIQF